MKNGDLIFKQITSPWYDIIFIKAKIYRSSLLHYSRELCGYRYIIII